METSSGHWIHGYGAEEEFWAGNRKLGVVNKCTDGMRLSKQTVLANSSRLGRDRGTGFGGNDRRALC